MTAKEPLEERIDEALESIAQGWRSWTIDQLDGTSFIKDELDQIDFALIEAKEALLSAFRDEKLALIERVKTEVIGEDYEPWYETSHNDTAVIIARKNELRAEQRTALDAIKAEVEGKG